MFVFSVTDPVFKAKKTDMTMKTFMKFCLMTALAAMSMTLSAQDKRKSIMYERGYAADVQIGTVLSSSTQYSISTSHGFRFGNGLYVGGGISIGADSFAYNGREHRVLTPVFADIKYSFINRLASPFVALKAGGMCDWTSIGVGYFLRPSLGVDIWNFSISVGCDFNNLRYYGGQGTNGHHNYYSLGMSGVYIGLSYNF